MRRPALLLLDEPVSALDWKMRAAMIDWVGALHRDWQFSALVISHDPREWLDFAKRAWTIEQGRIEAA